MAEAMTILLERQKPRRRNGDTQKDGDGEEMIVISQRQVAQLGPALGRITYCAKPPASVSDIIRCQESSSACAIPLEVNGRENGRRQWPHRFRLKA